MKIGIITCGNDAPGMNAVIWAAYRAATAADIELVGIRNGFLGLLDGDIISFNQSYLDRMFLSGGSLLGASKTIVEKSEKQVNKAKSTLKKNHIDGLIVCGDKDALSCIDLLSNKNLNIVGIPATIDNDIAYTDSTIGFDTVCNIIVESVMRLRDTIMSQKCIAIVEVAGDTCGDIAMNVGMASGTDYILVPEMLDDYKSPFDIDNMFECIADAWERGKHYIIIVISEGVTAAYKDIDIREELLKKADEYNSCNNCGKSYEDKISTKIVRIPLGYLQRGGEPSVQDTKAAMEMALTAVNLLAEDKSDILIGIKKNEIFSIDTISAQKVVKSFNRQMYDRVNSILTSR